MNRSESEILALNRDSLFSIFQLVDGKDLCNIRETCTTLRDVIDSCPSLWKICARREFLPHYQYFTGMKGTGRKKSIELYQHCRNVGLLKHAKWTQMTKPLQHRPQHQQPGYRSIEGHALCVYQDRYIVCAGGWAAYGLTNDVQIFDTYAAPDNQKWNAVKTRGSKPPTTYGYSLTTLGDGRILRYGGCASGGYYDSLNCCHILTLSAATDDSSEFTGEWTALEPPEGELTDRMCTAYHGAACVDAAGTSVLIFNGLTEDDANPNVMVLDTTDGSSFLPPQGGSRPNARYGAAVHVVDNKLWVLGGCSGGDLRRDGEDFKDVHCADLTDLLAMRQLSWIPLGDEIVVPDIGVGRELASAVVGRKILLHAGSGILTHRHAITHEVTNGVTWFDTDHLTFGKPRIFGDHAPSATLSAEAVCIGKDVWVYGGWSNHNLHGDVYRLQLDVSAQEAMQHDALVPLTNDRTMGRGVGAEGDDDDDDDDEPPQLQFMHLLRMLMGRDMERYEALDADSSDDDGNGDDSPDFAFDGSDYE
eukprot:m.561841 g.561841  ORF g.561841 m.561841 type:complete len:532 (-) comp22217_c1_seq5:628-2223(-)